MRPRYEQAMCSLRAEFSVDAGCGTASPSRYEWHVNRFQTTAFSAWNVKDCLLPAMVEPRFANLPSRMQGGRMGARNRNELWWLLGGCGIVLLWRAGIRGKTQDVSQRSIRAYHRGRPPRHKVYGTSEHTERAANW